MDISQFKDIHVGGRVFILASGPSLLDFDPEDLQDEILITVNEAVNRFPWTQYACAMDAAPYEVCSRSDAVVFTTRKSAYPDVRLRPDNTLGPFTFDLTKGYYPGGTTTFLALHVAVYMGFNDIYLCGLDLRIRDNFTHFFGIRDNFNGVTGCNFPFMKKSFEDAAPLLLHKNVVNCSIESTLNCFPKQNIFEVLQQLKPQVKPSTFYPIIESTPVLQLTLEKNVVLIENKYRIQLPDSTFLDDKYTMREYAQPVIDAINEALRRKGGRPRKPVKSEGDK